MGATTMSVKEYDLSKWNGQIAQILVGACICFGIHYRYLYVVPLVMQVFMTPTSTLECQLAQIYLFGKLAKGSLKRPWATPSPFGMIQEVSKDAKKKIRFQEGA